MYKGFMTPVATALTKEGKIDYPANERIIEHLIGGGVTGLLFLGSTGEFFALDAETRREYSKFVIEKVNKRVPVIIGTGGMDVKEVLDFTKHVETQGADAAIIISPYYFALSEESLEKFYCNVAENTNIDILIYNFPDRNGVNISANLVLKLAKKHKRIVGIKDSIPSMTHTRELIDVVTKEIPEFAVFSGYDEYFISNLLSGGAGCINGLSNIAPKLFSDWYKAYNESNINELARIQKIVNHMMALYEIDKPFLSVVKKAMQLVGVDMEDTLTEPMLPVTEKMQEKIAKILRECEII
jgi:2-dehydro-3-deoxy-D-pentonate aldolase